MDLTKLLAASAKRPLTREDCLDIANDARLVVDMVGAKLAAMKELAQEAARSGCDPVRRIELNMQFRELAKDINEIGEMLGKQIKDLDN